MRNQGDRIAGLVTGLILAAACLTSRADDSNDGGDSLRDLDLEHLMALEVTSVSRKPEPYDQAPAALFVLTSEDIRRSGVDSIPAALRLVPGLSVAQAGAWPWAISSRGLSSLFADHLLVLVDGRSVYSPAFSGVFWDMLTIPLDSIARIEVIRGPGGTMWGSNAVNGVINIITKPASEMQGGIVSARLGTRNNRELSVNYGQLSQPVSWRIFAQQRASGSTEFSGGGDVGDGVKSATGGFRLDGVGKRVRYSVQGGTMSGDRDEFFLLSHPTPPLETIERPESHIDQAHLLGRVEIDTASAGSWSVQAYRSTQNATQAGFRSDYSYDDVDLQHRVKLGGRHELIWGGNWRNVGARSSGEFEISFREPRFRYHQWSVFAQDEWRSVDSRWRVVLGAKNEYHPFTGWELQPNLRVTYVAADQVVWGSVSSGVHVPSSAQREVLLQQWVDTSGFLPVLFRVDGNPAVGPVRNTALELGYRWRPSSEFSLSAAASRAHYDHLIAAEKGDPIFVFAPIPHIEIQAPFSNIGTLDAYSAEVTAEWRPLAAMRLIGSYSWFQKQQNVGGELSPRGQALLRGSFDFGSSIEWDLSLRHIGRLPDGPVPAYTEADTRLGIRLGPSWELALDGRNLLHRSHLEFIGEAIYRIPTEVPRTVSLSVRWRERHP